MKKFFVTLAIVIAFSSCARQTFNFQKGNAGVEKSSEWSQFIIGGIAQSSDIDVIAICGSADKVRKVEAQLTFVNIIISMFTLNIYTPRTYRVFCAA
ncbi:MAG: Bor family protein [Fusobacteriaceae bacterium]